MGHLREAGFSVKLGDAAHPAARALQARVPADLRSCHTALVGGYMIEGHVPAADVRRLLRDRPKVTGLAVPGMPNGSPGMEGPKRDPYDVVAFAPDRRWVFASYRP